MKNFAMAVKIIKAGQPIINSNTIIIEEENKVNIKDFLLPKEG